MIKHRDVTSWKTTIQKPELVDFTLKGSKDSPVINPAIIVKHWNSNRAKILVNGKETRKQQSRY